MCTLTYGLNICIVEAGVCISNLSCHCVVFCILLVYFCDYETIFKKNSANNQ